MNEETKKALEEYHKAREEVDELCFFNNPTHCYTTEDSEAFWKAYQKERKALKKYKILLYEGMGWTEGMINDCLKKAGLSNESGQ